MSKKPRVFSREFKLMVVRRLLAGEKMSVVAQETQVLRKDLYIWRDRYRSGGAEALRGCGRPPKSEATAAHKKPAEVTPQASGAELDVARQRIAELERKIGQQQVELDFFRQALRRVKEARQPSTGPGVTGSTRSSKR
jgi:transposase-like protein